MQEVLLPSSYREAVMLTKENDAEGEAIALSRLGSIYDKVIKGKVSEMRAKNHMMRCIQLALSLHPKTFETEVGSETQP